MSDNCTRYRQTYRGINLYIVVSDELIHISHENSDNFKTTAAMSLIEGLLNGLLAEGWSLERLAGLSLESSYSVGGTLPEVIHNAIMHHIDRGNNGKI